MALSGLPPVPKKNRRVSAGVARGIATLAAGVVQGLVARRERQEAKAKEATAAAEKASKEAQAGRIKEEELGLARRRVAATEKGVEVDIMREERLSQEKPEEASTTQTERFVEDWVKDLNTTLPGELGLFDTTMSSVLRGKDPKDPQTQQLILRTLQTSVSSASSGRLAAALLGKEEEGGAIGLALSKSLLSSNEFLKAVSKRLSRYDMYFFGRPFGVDEAGKFNESLLVIPGADRVVTPSPR